MNNAPGSFLPDDPTHPNPFVAVGFDCSVPARRRVVSNRVIHREAPPPVVLTGDALMAALRADGERVRREWDRMMEEALTRDRKVW